MTNKDWDAIRNGRPRLQDIMGASYDDVLKRDAEQINAIPGDETGYDCAACQNRGYIAVVEDGALAIRRCDCMKVRACLREFERLGVNSYYTFDSFTAMEDWQKFVLNKAKAYAARPSGWFFIGGQVGCGKSHICTAILRELLTQKMLEARYMAWGDVCRKLKSCVNELELYQSIIEPLQKAEVLYIDDFFKPVDGGGVSAADVKQAYAILNSRYNNAKLLTIISSEEHLSNILTVDEAVGSRILERARDYMINVKYGAERNYRLKMCKELI